MTNLQIAMISLLIAAIGTMILVPAFLPTLHRLHFGQAIREEGPKSHMKKQGTPTMGGLMIQLAVIIAVLFAALITKKISLFLLVIMLVYGAIGFIDDYIKVSKKHNEGLTVIQKLVLQIITALIFTFWGAKLVGTELLVPFAGYIDFGIWYYPLTFIAIVAVTNAVNLTDGLDGLASGCMAVVMIFFTAGAITVSPAVSAFCGAVIGGCLGFLKNNSNPADIFMGDTGSMALGGALVGAAMLTQLTLYILIAGLIFVIEALSVVIQVGYFKISHGKRVFRMAPIHHHFELGGWSETRVVQVFWVFSALCVALAFLLI